MSCAAALALLFSTEATVLRPVSGAGNDAAFGPELGVAGSAVDAGARFLAKHAFDRVANVVLALVNDRAVGQVVLLAFARHRQQLLPALRKVAAHAGEQAFDGFIAQQAVEAVAELLEGIDRLQLDGGDLLKRIR